MHRRFVVCFSACFAVLAVVPAMAAAPPSSPITIAVGSPAVDGHRLQPYENVWRYTAVAADGTAHVQGLWSDRLDRIEKDGRSLMRRVQGMTYVNGATTSTINVFDPATMEAVASETHRIDGSWLKRGFDGTRVGETRGASPADKTGTTTTVTLPQPVFDFWGGMYGTLLAGLDLKPGMRGTLPAMAEFDPAFQPASFRIVREEDLAAGALGTVHTYVVESEGMTFWLSPKAPYVLRLDFAMANGVTARWTEL